MDIKSSNVGSKPPAGSESTDSQKASRETKPTKQFKEVLAGSEQAQGKQSRTTKGKGFPAFGKRPIPKKAGKGEGSAQGLHGEKALHAGKQGKSRSLHGEGKVQKTLGQEGEGKEVPLLSGKKKDLDSMLHKKDKKTLDESNVNIPGGVLMGPSALQQKAAVEKLESRGLSMSDMESIVQKVQVGVNEEGLPEFRFELITDKLGNLDLNVTADGNKIKIEILAKDAAAQTELEKNLNELGEMLQRRGLTLAEAQVNTRDDSSERRERQEEQRQQHAEQQDQDTDI